MTTVEERGATTRAAPWVLMAGVAVVGAQSLLLAPVLPDVAASLGVGPATVGRATAASGLATALAALAGGRLVDPLPRRAVLRVAAVVLALGLVVCAVAPHWAVLAAGQAVVGLAAGVTLPVSYALAGDLAPAGAETRVLGRVLLGWSLAMVVAVPTAAALGDLVGWRGVLLVLAALAAAMTALLGLLPAGPSRADRGPTARYREAAGRRGVRPLLLVVVAYMAAFYGAYGYLGDSVRTVHDAGSGTAGLVALAYGLGFGAAGLLDGAVDRAGPHRLLVPAIGVLVVCYALLPAAAARVPVLLALAAVWGVVNHTGLGVLVALLARCGGDARGPVMALYSGATYLAAAAAVAGLGPVYERAGLTGVATAAVALLLLATAPAVRAARTAGPVTA